jgi:hypothetical protein
MNEHRRQILDMLSAGKITADEAERLLAALDKSESATASETASPSPAKARYLRVLVDSLNVHNPYNGPVKVNIRVPMQLLRAGVRLAGLIPPHARGHVNEAMRRKGIPFDLNQIRPDNLEALVDQLDDISVDVDMKNKNGGTDDSVRVRVFCE